MPGLVKDPVQNPTESRFGFFMDMDDGHLKIYLKLDEDECNDETNQSRYFTFHTPVKQCVLKASLSIDKDDLNNNECLKIFGEDREDIINALRGSNNIPIEIYLVKFNDQMTTLSDQPLTLKVNDYLKNKMQRRQSGNKYKPYNNTEIGNIKNNVDDDR